VADAGDRALLVVYVLAGVLDENAKPELITQRNHDLLRGEIIGKLVKGEAVEELERMQEQSCGTAPFAWGHDAAAVLPTLLREGRVQFARQLFYQLLLLSDLRSLLLLSFSLLDNSLLKLS